MSDHIAARHRLLRALAWAILSAALIVPAVLTVFDRQPPIPGGRSEVVFWHFWGGRERPIVESIVARFNAQQSQYFVRAIAVPGNNLDLKFFLSVAGGAPPDVLNQDDPVVADWAHRGLLTPLAELAGEPEAARLEAWLFPPARALGSYDGQLYALCNGLDIRALYFDQAVLDDMGRKPPTTIAELDSLAEAIAPATRPGLPERMGYLPDPRRLWAWGIVFGGVFYDPTRGQITANSRPVVQALTWMAGYRDRYGADRLAAFRAGDQAFSGSAFPLLEGRYAMIMDGQWRVAEIEAAQAAAAAAGQSPPRVGVVPLPPPPDGLPHAGWVNGNFFVVPRGGRNPAGAWAFMQFWAGFGGHESEAAASCVAGGWIPASAAVVAQPAFQHYLSEHPLFAVFVELADSPNQVPVPSIPTAPTLFAEVNRAAEDVLYRGADPQSVLDDVTHRAQARLDEVRRDAP